MVIKGDVGGGDTHEVNDILGQSDPRRNDNRPLSASTNQDADTVPASISPDDGATSVSQLKHCFSS